jgi:hypothetical protein
MKIEMIETVKHERDEYLAEDQRTVPDELGAYFCANGWAKDIEGQVPTGERKTGVATVTPDNVKHTTKAGDANG